MIEDGETVAALGGLSVMVVVDLEVEGTRAR